MNKDAKTVLPEKLTLTANLTSGLNIVVNISYILLSILTIAIYFNCSVGIPENVSGAEYFWSTAYRVYFQDDSCENSLMMAQLTSSHTVFILSILILCVSVLGLITAIGLIIVVKSEEPAQYIQYAIYGHLTIFIAALIIDLTLASHFGIDYSYLSSQLQSSSGGLGFNYERDVIRHSAFLLMAFTLKGYIYYAINIVLMVLLVINLVEFQKKLKTYEHPIHKVGVLNAYDNHRRNDDWPSMSNSYPTFPRGPNINGAFVNDNEPLRISPLREPNRSDFYPNNNRSFDRSDSWQRSQPNPNQAGRPFSYLEDTRRPIPVKPPSSPAVDPSWRRDPWPSTPPVPQPDYSPQTPRRLKSAMKSGYM